MPEGRGRKRHLDLEPRAGRDSLRLEGFLGARLLHDLHAVALRLVPDEHHVDLGGNPRGAVAECPLGDAAGRRHHLAVLHRIRRHVAREADARRRRAGQQPLVAEIDARRRVRLEKHERTRSPCRHQGIGRAELGRERDLGEESRRHRLLPRHLVVLHERRIGDRNAHLRRLEVRAPPNLDLGRAFVDAVNCGFKVLEGIVFGLARHIIHQVFDRHRRIDGNEGLSVRAVVEPRVPVASARFRLVDVAGEVVVHPLGHRPRVGSRLKPDARRQLLADGPLEYPGRRHRLLGVVRQLHREIGRATGSALIRELDEDLAALLATERERSLAGVVVGRNRRRHLEAGHRRHVVRGYVHGAASLRPAWRHDDAQGLLRPADEIIVVLEVPLRLHRVFRLPEDFRLPGHGHAGRTRRHVRRRDGEHLAVVGVCQFLPLRGLVLLKIGRMGVVGLAIKSGSGDRVELVVRVSAAGRLQAVADLGVERRHVRRADLDDDVRDHVVFRLGVVVGEHELALRTFYRARLLVHVVAHGKHLRVRRIVVDTVNHVGHALRFHLVNALQEVLVAEELHELSGEVDERGVVGLIDARREEPVWTRRRRAADVVGARVARARRGHPRQLRCAARGEDHTLVFVRCADIEDNPAFGDRRGVRGHGRGPVNAFRIKDRVGAKVAELGVRRLLRKRPADRPRRKLPLHRRVLGRNGRHPLFGRCRRTDGRNRIRYRRLRVAGGATAAVDVNGQLHFTERELNIRRHLGKRRGECCQCCQCCQSQCCQFPIGIGIGYFHIFTFPHFSGPPFR